MVSGTSAVLATAFCFMSLLPGATYNAAGNVDTVTDPANGSGAAAMTRMAT
jgi:hypothetical protein